LSYFGTEEYTLANGAVVEEPVYRGKVVIDNRAIEALMCISEDDEALLGTRLLDGKIVTPDFVNYRITETPA
jgi:predicted aspartyl protease